MSALGPLPKIKQPPMFSQSPIIPSPKRRPKPVYSKLQSSQLSNETSYGWLLPIVPLPYEESPDNQSIQMIVPKVFEETVPVVPESPPRSPPQSPPQSQQQSPIQSRRNIIIPTRLTSSGK